MDNILDGNGPHGGYVPPNHQSVMDFRAPTVNEALPYTPLSSIIPFDAGLIECPRAFQALSAVNNAQTEEYASQRRILQKLNDSANCAEKASERFQQTLRQVQQLLKTDGSTQFTFKHRDVPQLAPTHSHMPDKSPKYLGAFSRLVLNSTSIHYRYPTPSSTDGAIKPEPNGTATSTKPIIAPLIEVKSEAPANLKFSASPNVQVIVSGISADQRALYQAYPDADIAAHASHKQALKRTEKPIREGRQAVSTDQRRLNDIAVKNLQEYMHQIFDAQDRAQMGIVNFDESGGDSRSMVSVHEAAEGASISMQPEVLSKLDSYLQRVVSADVLDQFEADDLSRLQKLSEATLRPVESLSLAFHEECNEIEVEQWLSKLAEVELALTASRSIMRIMHGMPQQKELQSEVYFREILEAAKMVIEDCIVPLVELHLSIGDKAKNQKDEREPNMKFTLLSVHSQVFRSTLHSTQKVLRVLGDLLVSTDFDAVGITTVEFLCKTLIFAENATNDRDSIFGVQQFESTRKVAMDVLAKVFEKYHDQRQYIIDEILFSLEKLPANRQSARQYRQTDAKPIQLVSALLMRLVQSSVSRSNDVSSAQQRSSSHKGGAASDEDDADESEASSDSDYIHQTATTKIRNHKSITDLSEEEAINKPTRPKANGGGSLGKHSKKLKAKIKPMVESAQQHASYIIRYLINRASNTTKSGDEPYRKLLDIFTEDFLNVLGNCAWPAAELLLFTLAKNMVGIVENTKNPAPSRTMALEFLGVMGSGILELHIDARNAARAIDVESNTGYQLAQMVNQVAGGNVDRTGILALDGPYGIVLQWLNEKGDGSSQTQATQDFYTTEWASAIVNSRLDGSDNDDGTTQLSLARLCEAMNEIVFDSQALEEHRRSGFVSESEARLAAKLLTLESRFCRAFNRIFSTLLANMSSELPTIRSRSLKSIDALLETDPTVLDRNSNVLQPIIFRSNDASPLVRDSALGLIAKCITLRPKLDEDVYQQVLLRTRDSASGVKRRAIKILKDIYLRNETVDIRAAIASTVTAKALDPDESISELARGIVEEIFFEPFHSLQTDGEKAVAAKLAYRAHVALLIRTLENSDEAGQIFTRIVRRVLSRSKSAAANTVVCKSIVSVLFDGMIDCNDIDGGPAQDNILKTLTVFARASPTLFTATQLERLEPYLSNLTTSEDLEIYRSAVTILRHTLPHQPIFKPEALSQLQSNLLRTIQKIPKSEIKEVAQEVAPCIWTISEMSGGSNMLNNFVRSAIAGVANLSMQNANIIEQSNAKATRLIHILGEFGRACDFDSQLEAWKSSAFQWFRGDNVAGLMVEILCRFMDSRIQLEVRTAALDAICSISQTWPEQFLRPDVTNIFEQVFQDRVPELEETLVRGLEIFFRDQEKPSDDDLSEDAVVIGGIATGKERLGRTYMASNEDSALTSLAQRFLPQIRRLALAACNETAFAGARLIITINSQGLGHPKDSAPALVALETCPNAVIAKKAFDAHKDQGLSRESVFEKEYMRGVQAAFEYQQRVVGDINGHVGQPPAPKMRFLWDVLRAGKASVRNKFIANIARKLDFDLASVKNQHLSLVYFCVGNLALFDFEKLDEVLSFVVMLEKIFSSTGTTIAHAIETEVLKLELSNEQMPDATRSTDDMSLEQSQPRVNTVRLARLALAAQTLCLLWETRTFLRKVWSLQKHSTKTKRGSKDGGNKNAYRVPSATALTETYLQNSQSLSTAPEGEAAQRAMCVKFVEVFSVDNEVKVGTDEDANGELEDGDVSLSDAGSARSASIPPANGQGHGKKRKGSTSGGTPRKKGRPSPSKKVPFAAKASDDDDD